MKKQIVIAVFPEYYFTPTTPSPEVVTAEVFGVWAVHKAVRRAGWAITHIPTGLCAIQKQSRTDAIASAKLLHQLAPDFYQNAAWGKLASGTMKKEFLAIWNEVMEKLQ